jgi:hypothetical protein
MGQAGTTLHLNRHQKRALEGKNINLGFEPAVISRKNAATDGFEVV